MSLASTTLPNSLGLPLPPADTRVVVAMSGGVDSSVVAALLKAQGYDVVGITLQLYDHGEAVHRKGACCAGQDVRDARRVAETLGIPHYVLDYERRFATEVMDAFADSYLAGETPVPCVACNQRIKFRDLLETAKQLGAHALATGHYIRSKPGPTGMELHRAIDADRDQSYFLFATTREQLDFLRFPLGGLHKPETREQAAEFGLEVAAKSDSQDICFVPTGRYTQVIERLRPGAAEPGQIVHGDGRVLGQHKGIINYTIGQRRGIGISAGEPLYVVQLDADRREVIVGPREALRTHMLHLRDLNWIGDGDFAALPETGLNIEARIRSSQAPKRATLYNRGGVAVVRLHEGEDGVSPGQACVFYAGTRVLGGGWIETTQSDCAGRTAVRKTTNGAMSREAALNLSAAPLLRGRRIAAITRKVEVVREQSLMDVGAVLRAYRRWAPVYDYTFGQVAEAGRKHAVEIINRRRGTVLEVGVGTGLSLPCYGRHLQITGIDLSPEMLAKAETRVREHRLNNVLGLYEMDAGELDFADDGFDTVVAMYVMTVVPEPEQVMSELERVCAPGGEVILVNHFSSEEDGVRGWFERRLAPLSENIGWRPIFPIERVLGCQGLRLKDRQGLRPFGLFTMLRFIKQPQLAADSRLEAGPAARGTVRLQSASVQPLNSRG